MRQDTEEELGLSCKCCGRPYEIGVSVPYAPWRSYSDRASARSATSPRSLAA
jgi:hypothetical protein